MKKFAEVAEDPALPSSILRTIVTLSGRTDFRMVLIIASDEGQSMLNNILDRDDLAEVLQDALDKVRGSGPTMTIRAQQEN